MTADLTITLPDETMALLTASAERDFRTPEMQAAWFLHRMLTTTATRLTRDNALNALSLELQKLHAHAGTPSMRQVALQIERNSGFRVSHTSVHQALRGTRPVSWAITEAIVTVLDGDVELIRDLWPASQTTQLETPKTSV